MDITPATAVALNQSKLQNEMAVRVLRKALDVSADQGAELVKMVAQEAGVGKNLDVLA